MVHPARSRVDPERAPLIFAGSVLCASLFLQRFGLSLGDKGFSLVGPIGLLLTGIGLFDGTLTIHRPRLCGFLILLFFALLAASWRAVVPNSFGTAPNFASLSQFLLLTSFATVSFAQPVAEARFFRLTTLLLTAIAIAGVLQFAAQFIGLSLFSFTGILPDSILYEKGYNLQIPIVSGLYKSNGFFLVEPSVFSQFMALALAIEITAFKRLDRLCLFAAGLMLSFSGTGWIVLGCFIVAVAFGMGARGVALAAATVAMLLLAVGAMYLFAPELLLVTAARINEVSQINTSGHLRFVTPFWALADVLHRDPVAIILGIGAGVTERLPLTYDYAVNTPVKVLLEYGAPALIAYVALFVSGHKSTVQKMLVLPGIVMFLFTGGYQQFPPVLFSLLLILSVARLRNSNGVSDRGA
jgi:hypothetical protein